jgi:Ca-activated chloride channel homolog
MVLEITFEQPFALWFLFSLPLLVFTHLYFLRHAKKQAIQFGNFQTLERVTGKKLLTKNVALLVLRCLIVLCLVLAAAETTWWKATDKGVYDMVILLDASASMAASDMNGPRIDAAKEAAKTFVEESEGASHIAVVQFSGLPEVLIAPTADKNSVVSAIDAAKIKTVGGTDVSGAIVTGASLLSNSKHGRVILLITDGVSSVSLYDENPLPQAILYAQRQEVIIHTIGMGTQANAAFLPNMNNKAKTFDEQNLQEIANATGGTYAWATNPTQLETAYETVLAEGSTAVVPLKLSFAFLFIALLLVFTEWGLMNTRYRLLP